MIKESAYIRQFTPEQKKQLQAIATEQKIKNATDVFLFTLDQYTEQKNEVARLKRLLEYKQNKVDNLKEKIEYYENTNSGNPIGDNNSLQ